MPFSRLYWLCWALYSEGDRGRGRLRQESDDFTPWGKSHSRGDAVKQGVAAAVNPRGGVATASGPPGHADSLLYPWGTGAKCLGRYCSSERIGGEERVLGWEGVRSRGKG